jgi:hypothetical protein
MLESQDKEEKIPILSQRYEDIEQEEGTKNVQQLQDKQEVQVYERETLTATQDKRRNEDAEGIIGAEMCMNEFQSLPRSFLIELMIEREKCFFQTRRSLSSRDDI